MKMIIHDLTDAQIKRILPNDKDVVVISNNEKIHHCIGCFGCWIKTPGECFIRDNYGDMGELWSKCDEVIVVSECFYGGYNPFVKNVFDRTISYVHPYFIFKNSEMHHRKRYDNQIKLSVWFYGEDITDQEKVVAEKLVYANSINFHSSCEVHFKKSILDIGGHLL